MRIRHLLVVALLAACGPGLESPPQTAAAFEWFEYTGQDEWFALPAESGTFRNPVLAGFHPDPSILRVGDDYYLVNSSFGWYPGVPIFHSTDLVNWTQLGYVLDRPGSLPVQGLGISRGVFAPTLRYRDGVFYMITTLVDAGGNFYVTATNPAGPWSDPTWLPDVDGIDPSIFFDIDGRAYITNNGPPDYEPLYDGHRAIWIQEFDVAAGKTTGPRKVILDGGVDLSSKPVWIEGPHIYRVGDWYYLIAAEGGTGHEHSQVVFRSRDVFGPWEPGSRNPILTQRDLDPSRPFPVTTTGHADFVQTPAGDWWSVFLACRPYEDDYYNTGRETFLLPVTWTDGWPMILEPDLPVPAVLAAPDLRGSAKPPVPTNGNFTWRDEFDGTELALAWNSLRGPSDPWLDLATTPGAARLEARSERLTGRATPAYLARRQQHAAYTASTALRLDFGKGMSAGLAAFQNEARHFYLGVARLDGAWRVFVEAATPDGTSIIAEQRIEASSGESVELKVSASGRPYAFHYRFDDGDWTELLAGADGSLLRSVVPESFVGSYIGMHARTE